MTKAELNRLYQARYRERHRERLRTRQREWRAANPERTYEIKKAHYHANRSEYVAKKRTYNSERREEINAKSREYRAANIAKVLARCKAYREANRETLRAKNRAYAKANRALVCARSVKRQAAQRQAIPPWADTEAIRRLYLEASRLTDSTGIKHVVDHIVPLRGKTVCGLHVAHNLQVITEAENLRKSNRLFPAA